MYMLIEIIDFIIKISYFIGLLLVCYILEKEFRYVFDEEINKVINLNKKGYFEKNNSILKVNNNIVKVNYFNEFIDKYFFVSEDSVYIYYKYIHVMKHYKKNEIPIKYKKLVKHWNMVQ